jgi:hypothetical protein
MPSFNLDITYMLQMAANMFNALGPVWFIIIGVSIGVGLLTKILAELKKAF